MLAVQVLWVDRSRGWTSSSLDQTSTRRSDMTSSPAATRAVHGCRKVSGAPALAV